MKYLKVLLDVLSVGEKYYLLKQPLKFLKGENRQELILIYINLLIELIYWANKL